MTGWRAYGMLASIVPLESTQSHSPGQQAPHKEGLTCAASGSLEIQDAKMMQKIAI